MGTECSLPVQKSLKFKEYMSIENNCSMGLVVSMDRTPIVLLLMLVHLLMTFCIVNPAILNTAQTDFLHFS
jgi:hypothetical protein